KNVVGGIWRMMSASESLDVIDRVVKTMKAAEGNEAALSTNRPWIVASRVKVKRGPSTHTPLEGDAPETYFSLTERTLNSIALMLMTRRRQMEGRATRNDELEVRRKAVLSEIDVPPMEVAFLFGYTSPNPVKELRIRHGKDPNTGRPLKDSQRPLLSTSRRARKP